VAPNQNIQTYLGKVVHCPNHPDLKDPVRCPAGCPQPVAILRPSSTGNRSLQVRHFTVIRSWKMTCSRGKYSNRKGWESSNQLVNVLDTFSWCQAVCSVYINVLIDSTSAFTKCILYGCMYVCIHDHACMYIHNYVYTLYRTINTIRTVYRSMLESLYSWKKRIKQAFTEQSVKIPPSIVPCFAPETWSRPFSPL